MYDSWFSRGEFEFTVDEVMALLRQDQENSGQQRLALVLPGGGVKAAYQSRLLDQIYAMKWLANPSRDQPAAAEQKERNEQGEQEKFPPLQVDTVAGTSGGAMVGAFAARSKAGRSLQSLWLSDKGEVTTSAADIFPLLGILRFTGVYAVLAVVQLMLVLYFWFRRDSADKIGSYEPAPKRITALVALLIIAGPAVIRFSLAPIEMAAGGPVVPSTYVPVVEAFVFGAIVCLSHFVLTCCVRVKRDGPGQESKPAAHGGRIDCWAAFFKNLPRDVSHLLGFRRGTGSGDVPVRSRAVRRAHRLGGLLMLAGIALAAVAAASRSAAVQLTTLGPFHVYLHSALTAAGLLLSASAVVLLAAAGNVSEMVGCLDYAKAMAVVVGVVGATFVVIGLAAHRGAATLLEIAPQFWAWTGLASLVCIALLCVLAKFLPRTALGKWVFERLWYLSRHMSFLGRTTTPLGSMLILNGVALVLWAVWVTPALYDNASALAFFRHRLQTDLGGETKHVTFDANLVVTGSSLEPTRVGETVLGPGDQYFCFDGITKGCPRQARSLRWHNVTGAVGVDDVLNPVFASGSPFPVLPDHAVQIASFSGRLVDGGYVHNTPLQAAALTGARQVLIVNSSPREKQASAERAGGLSRLAKNIARLLPFMFDESQSSDRDLTPSLTVASLSPICDQQPFPFLADFRPRVVKRMVACATSDLEGRKRIGRVESWGHPRQYSRIAAPAPAWEGFFDSQWKRDVEKALAKKLNDVETGNTRSPALDAAFDVDDTLIKNDAGEAFLRELILRRQYAYASPAFWALFRDEKTKRDLKAAAAAHPCQGASFDDVGAWSDACRDYFDEFWGYYQALVERDPADAYQWTAQLIVGLRASEVDHFAADVWDQETKRPLRPVTITSPHFPTASIQLGLRLFEPMRKLVATLRERHWNVWLVSASLDPVVKQIAARVGVAEGHVLGVHLASDSDGRFTATVERFPFQDGKVAALTAVGALEGKESMAFAAGDSAGDVPMLKRARVALMIDHGKIEPKQIQGPGALWQPQFRLGVEGK
jgi:HAD superfamily phosphoserine phosphatase-like hydrolase